MKKLLVTTLLLYSATLLLGQSARQLEKDFVEEPTASNLRTFEVRAQQKAKDFVGYINIMLNPKYDSVFQQVAYDEALKLFETADKAMTFDFLFIQTKQWKLVAYLDIVCAKGYKGKLTLKSLSVSKPLVSMKRGGYSGVIKTQLSGTVTQDNKEVEIEEELFFNIRLSKVVKSFGSETMEVWEVFLSDIVIETN